MDDIIIIRYFWCNIDVNRAVLFIIFLKTYLKNIITNKNVTHNSWSFKNFISDTQKYYRSATQYSLD